MIRLASPEWLILLPLLAGLWWRWPRFRQPWRVVCLLLLWLALLDPQTRQKADGLDLWVIADRSASAQGVIEPQWMEWERLLERSKGRHDRLFVVDYAAEATLRDPQAGLTLSGSREATRTGVALHYALSLMEPERHSRLLLLSDGFSTDSLETVTERLGEEVALDFRLPSAPFHHDVRVESLTLPQRVLPGEPFIVEARVRGPGGSVVPYEVLRNGTSLLKEKVTIPVGQGWAPIRFTDRLAAPGAHRYEVHLSPENDPIASNNVAAQWVETLAGSRLLLATAFADDPVAEILRAQGFDVEVVTQPARLDVGRLQGTRAVILHNVPAHEIPRPFLDALPFFVRHQGGGLMMIGGGGSFGSGGYFGSPLADLLPVSMELRNDQRKLMTAMAISLDRSGSMTASAGGGMTKIQLAANAAARAIDLLGAQDAISVHAVDTAAHVIVPLSAIGADRAKLTHRVRGITSAGGGIFVGEALKAARQELMKSKAGVRHLLLFADAADAEEPGEYQRIIPEMTAAGITISVIGLGAPTDSDAGLLREIAELGKGRVFFTEEAAELPAIFEQETVTVARSAFVKEVTPTQPLPTWAELAARPLEWLPQVDAFNLSYLQEGATAALLTAGEEKAPLVAFWQRGGGRVAAIAFPLGGPHSEAARAWPKMGDFTQTLARWLLGTAPEAGLGLRAEVVGSELRAELFYGEEWEGRMAQHPPDLLLAGKGEEAERLVWERMEPGRFRATRPLEPGQLVRGVVAIGETRLPFGPVLAGSGAEWEFDPARPAEIRALAAATGGVERLDLAKIWDAPRRSGFSGWREWLLGALVMALLVETLLGRLGKSLTVEKRAAPVPKAAPVKKSSPTPPPPPAVKPPASVPQPPSSAEQRRKRFERARRDGL